MSNKNNDNTITSSKRWVILITVSFTMMLLNLNFTALNLALLSINTDITSTLDIEHWVLSIYVLVIAILLFPSSRLSNLYKKRSIFFWAAFIFSFASLIIATANDLSVFLLGRSLQAVGAALFIPTLYFFAFKYFAPEKKTTAIAIVTAGISIGLSMGPTIGPFIQEASSWRWIFFINVPICAVIALIIALTTQKDTAESSDHKKYLYLFFLLCGLLIFMPPLCLKYSLVSFNLIPWAALLAICLIYYFLPRYDTDKQPLLPVSLFSIQNFDICALIVFCIQYTFVAVLFVSCIYMEAILGYGVLRISMILAALTASMGVFSAITPYLVSKIGNKALIVIGFIFSALGCYLFAQLGSSSTISQIVLSLLPAGTGIGLLLSLANILAAQSAPSQKIRITSGMVYALSAAASAFGIFISAESLVIFGQRAIYSFTQTSKLSLTSADITAIKQAIQGPRYSLSQIKGESISKISSLDAALQDAFSDAMFYTLLVPTFLCTVAAVYIFFKLKEENR